MKLFLYSLRAYDEKPICEELAIRYGWSVGSSSEAPSLQNAILAAGYDAISFTVSTMDKTLLETFARLGVRAIICRSIGYDHVDLKAAEALELAVYHAAYPPEGVADYAIMLAMMGLRKMPLVMKKSAEGDFTLRGRIGRALGDVSVGVVGTGRIGLTVLRHLSGFGSKLFYWNRKPNPEADKLATYLALDKLLAASDVVTLHLSSNPETFHLLDARRLGLMKQDSVLVNTARGQLVDTSALIASLQDGRPGFALLDVQEKEDGLYYFGHRGETIPYPEYRKLQAMEQVLLSPHIAFYTEGDLRAEIQSNFDAALAFSRGEESPYRVRS